MHPGWISNHWTPGCEHFTGNPGSPTKSTNCVPKDTPQPGWPCFSIRNTRSVGKHTIHSPLLQSQPPQWETLGTSWAGHDYSVFPQVSWKLLVAIHGNEFHHGLNCGVSSNGGASRKTRWEKRFVMAHVEKTFAQEAHAPLVKDHPFMGILISRRCSFPSWDHPEQPEACIYLSMASVSITSWEIDWKTVETVSYFIFFLGAPKSLQMVIAAMELKNAYSLEGKLWPT